MIIGITGGIGSGKSTITRELAYRGYAFYDCDKRAKQIIEEDQLVQFLIKRVLGKKAFDGDRYNTAYVSKRVFADPRLLQELNDIIHPRVYNDLEELKNFRDSRGATDLLFVESAILFESGLAKLCDRIVLVEAPEDIRIQRVMARDYHGNNTPEIREQIQARINAQQTFANLPPSTIAIQNDGKRSITELIQQILSQL